VVTTPDLPEHRKLLVSLPVAVVLLAPEQIISWVNPAAEQFFGQSNRRLMGKPLGDVLDVVEPRLAHRLAEGDAPVSARQIDVQLIGQGPRRLDITAGPVADRPGWMVMTLHDTVAADAMRENGPGSSQGSLRAPEILAHEIKNPLAGIKGAAQLLGRKVEGHDRSLTQLIADEVDRIAKLIDQMQTLSRRTAEPVAPCNLHEAIRRAGAIMMAATAGAQRIEEEFDPSLPPVMGSAHGLVQVLINLLANARDAGGGGDNARVVVRTRFASGLQLHAAGDGTPVRLPIEVRVSDNGPGIDPTMRDHIFEPFVSSKKSGQGLGLALVRKLVRDMNGRITHDRDEIGGWTHFRLHLPVAMEGGEKTARRAYKGQTVE
jgi:two-component system, NtrC family, nitrogen regulation sensor histidine kinase GlnL